ncbi:N-acetyllactosaminide beta-1,3-N-acetylglucosaminyltransferase 3-like [Anoplopoma fimbria]|uniref:N-acetyllactosaminide beta-1,3-N-acetylglucosaminyltransferase 3-like n=1 Tax=Anoplopoma fimbria TaxID=229290 RepID=UPI0023EBCACD|nr:N-acetyllactosaminide beta-1,3-N-acetylglucosaminyltransferase 3-like [Anoplopoma fimbria]
MPKIHPETKALIIKRLKTRSTAEVADTFNVSQRQVQRIRKRFEETGDVFDKPRSGRPRKTTAREDSLLARKSKASPFSTAAELHQALSPQVPVSTRTVCRILSRNGLHGRISAQKPALNKRASRKRKSRVYIWLLLVTFLVAVYLHKDLLHHKTIHVQDRKNDNGRTKAPARNNSMVISWPKCQINQSVANSSDFNNLTVNFQDFLYYQHCRHFPMLLDIPDKCVRGNESAAILFLLVIKSSPSNYDRREVLRKTWAEERLENGVQIRRIFIVGTAQAGFEGERLNKLLELEKREHNDILQWDFKDSFYNLTLKQILFLEWFERNCRQAGFLLNGDDDIFANTNNMVEYIKGLKYSDGSKHLFIGYLMVNSPPVRNVQSKYFVSVNMYKSDYFPPYCSGGGFIMSVHTALVIYEMSKSIDLVPIDDAYMGMCLAKAGLRPASHIGVEPLGWNIPSSRIDKYDPCYFKEKLLVHGFFSANMYFMWKKVTDPNLKCDTANKWLKRKRTVAFRW